MIVDIVLTIAILAAIYVMFCLSGLWAVTCFQIWIEEWAKRNSLKLQEYRLSWFQRPAWYTFLNFPMPVYRVQVEAESTGTRRGWVWLDPLFSFGGRGTAFWDEETT